VEDKRKLELCARTHTKKRERKKRVLFKAFVGGDWNLEIGCKIKGK